MVQLDEDDAHFIRKAAARNMHSTAFAPYNLDGQNCL